MMKKCPKCKKHYNEPPAISRVDNKTKICPMCGIAEAMVIANEIIEKRRINLTIDSLTPEEEKIIKHLTTDEK